MAQASGSHRRLPPHTLLTYLTSAARAMADGRPLDETSSEAVQDALGQLQAETAALELGTGSPTDMAALSTSTGASVHMTEILLEAAPRAIERYRSTATTLAEDASWSVHTLSSIKDLLVSMVEGDRDAARDLTRILTLAVDEVLDEPMMRAGA